MKAAMSSAPRRPIRRRDSRPDARPAYAHARAARAARRLALVAPQLPVQRPRPLFCAGGEGTSRSNARNQDADRGCRRRFDQGLTESLFSPVAWASTRADTRRALVWGRAPARPYPRAAFQHPARCDGSRRGHHARRWRYCPVPFARCEFQRQRGDQRDHRRGRRRALRLWRPAQLIYHSLRSADGTGTRRRAPRATTRRPG